MATTVDTLVTKYTMDNADYKAGAQGVSLSTEQIKSAATAAKGAITAFMTTVVAMTGALVSFGVAASQKAGNFDAMVKALEAIEGSAKKAKDAIAQLREVAKLPGLGLQEAIQGYSGLRRAGLDENTSMRIIRGAGNANALAGGGREELERILRALSQIAMKPNLQGEELMQLNEAGIAGTKIVTEAFGTADGTQLKKLGVDSRDALMALVVGMEAMPKAADSAKNAWENAQMSLEMAMIGVGDGLNQTLAPMLSTFGAAVDRLEAAGVFQTFGEVLASLFEVAMPASITEVDGMTEAIINVGAGAVFAVAALRNFYNNLEGLGDLLLTLSRIVNPMGAAAGDVATWGLKASASDAGGVDPIDEARAFVDLAHMRLELARKKAAKTPSGEVGGGAAAESLGPVTDPSLPLLTRIAVATEKEVELRAATIGGSALGDKAFNSVNISRASGVGGGRAGQIVGLIQSLVDDGVTDVLRARGLV